MKASNRRRIAASQSVQGPEKSPNRTFRAIQFSDSVLWATVGCATLVAYLPALHGGVLWDDSSHLTRPDIQSLHGLWRIWFDLRATQQYYPLLHSAFWLEHRIWGEAVLGYHLTNVGLHALGACLVVMIVRRLALPGAWLAGLVFALHPVHVESVAWMSEQKSTLSGVFYLASLLAYLHFDLERRKSKYWLATGLFVLALLSKSVTATLPAVLLVILWWRRGRLEWKRDVVPLIPWFALGVSSGLFTAWVERTVIGANGSEFLLTPAQRILIAGRVIFFYVGKLLWPANLMFFYPHWKVDPSVWWQWLFPLGALAIGIGLALAARHSRGPLTSFLIFSGTLFPVLGFLNVFPFRYSYVADHFQYLASLGIIVPATVLLVSTAERFSSQKAVTNACSAMLIVVLGILTWCQSRMYTDIETLYRASLARNPTSWLAHNNLGLLLADMPGRLPEAIAEYRAALELNPDYAEAHNNMGNALLGMLGMPSSLPPAIAEYQAALQIKPDFAQAHLNLGSLLAHVPGRLPDAIAEYQAALQITPDSSETHYNLGIALSRTPGRFQDAIAEYRTALKIRPDFAEAHNNLGQLLADMPGAVPEAIAEYKAALQIKPDFAEAHYNLGLMLADMPGRLPDAIEQYRLALQIKPDLAEAHWSLGDALSRIPALSREAVAEHQAAQRIASGRTTLLGAGQPPSK